MKTPAVVKLLLANLFQLTNSFPIRPMIRVRAPSHSYFGINEWRAENFSNELNTNERPVWLLPFEASDLLLIGENRTIVMNHGRFFDLFQDVVDQEQSIIGMALMGEDFLLPTVVLCEINDYQIDTGFRGRISIQVTLESVGRAEMIALLQMKPVMKANCRELVDDLLTELELQDIRKLEKEINDLVSERSTENLHYDSLETLSWAALSLVRTRCGAKDLLESFQIRNVKNRLENVCHLLRHALVSEIGSTGTGPWIDEPSVFE